MGEYPNLPAGLDPDGDGRWSAGVEQPGRWARLSRRGKAALVDHNAVQGLVAPAVLPPDHSPAARPARVIDGDTIEVDGTRIRIGLVDTPEQGQACFGEATEFTASFVAGGVEVLGYATDSYGRTVGEVLDGRARSLNVALAASGWANDQYLDQYRHENPELARRG